MPDNSGFLETETVVHNLLEELNKLKPAVDQIEDTKNSAKTIQESANNIVRGTNELLTTGKTILERVNEVRFKERFDEVEKLGIESVENDKTILSKIEDTKNSAETIQESANNIVRGTNELLTTSKTILERVDGVRFKERFDEVEKLGIESVENDKTILSKIEDTKNSAETIQESANNIVRGTNELLTTSKTILERVDGVRFKERFDEVEKLGIESVENDKAILSRIEDTKNSAETIQESANSIVRGTNELLTTSKTILERISEVRFKERFDEVEKLGMESVENDKMILNGIEDTKNSAETIQESANSIVRGTNELLTTSKTILERISEVRFKERFDEVEKLGMESVENDKTILNRIGRLEKRNLRLNIGIIGLLILQVTTLVFLFLK
jgi:uncharacterized protein YoxC